ncbi:hypothetical protein GE061_006881 [Apolygus lucorum]|uniref:LRRNT domain-containing protein n=1 Tax=Apolygus lucorum TaxID=248454 RepID=A0A8S9WRW2_APOLU|nr:hypothetical protein GE061_006881 [Apolygus lucorum]
MQLSSDIDKMVLLFLPFTLALVFVYTDAENPFCPARCVCSKFPIKSPSPYVERMKARCGGDIPVSSVEELRLNYYNLTDIINLDLQGNNITHLSANVFPVADLQKLDLSKNSIDSIEDGAFSNLISLKRLDLSNNRLRTISRSTFEGLVNLEKL